MHLIMFKDIQNAFLFDVKIFEIHNNCNIVHLYLPNIQSNHCFNYIKVFIKLKPVAAVF